MSPLASTEPVTVQLTGLRSLADLIWLANTRHGAAAHWFARPAPGARDHDHLQNGSEAVSYLADHKVEVPPGEPTTKQLRALAAIRDVVRDLAESPQPDDREVDAVVSVSSFRLGGDRRLRADGEGWDAFIGDLTLPLVELLDDPRRLRLCENPACRLVFVDDSRNQSRRWCDNAGCGNRFRVRRHRRD